MEEINKADSKFGNKPMLMIGVRKETKEFLFELKEFNESYEDVIIRLINFWLINFHENSKKG